MLSVLLIAITLTAIAAAVHARVTRSPSRPDSPRDPVPDSPRVLFSPPAPGAPVSASTDLPAPNVRCVPDSAIASLAARLERTRRIRAAEHEAEMVLAQLDPERWHIERNINLGGLTVAFVLAGPPGIVLLLATDGGWGLPDIQALHGSARETAALTGHEHLTAHTAIVNAYAAFPPGEWVSPGGGRGTVLSLPYLTRWLHELPGGELTPCDIAALRARSVIDWSRSASGARNAPPLDVIS